jgi:hypothetical protein
MPYNSDAITLRRCIAIKADGTPCRAFAMWNDPLDRCVVHAGRHHRGKQNGPRRPNRRNVPACHCPAYAWPHRPGGGLCRWPNDPWYICQTPASTHSKPRTPPIIYAMRRMGFAVGLTRNW